MPRHGSGIHGVAVRGAGRRRELQGIDLLRSGADGQISEFTVMIRPATGLIAVAERMGRALEAAGVR